MWAMLLGFSSALKVALGAGVLITGLLAWQWWDTRDLRSDLAEQAKELKETKDAALEAAKEAGRASEREEANRIKLEGAIATQRANDAMMRARVRQAETTAAEAARKVLRDSQDEAAALLNPATPIPEGYEALNAWQKAWKQRVDEGNK